MQVLLNLLHEILVQHVKVLFLIGEIGFCRDIMLVYIYIYIYNAHTPGQVRVHVRLTDSRSFTIRRAHQR